MDARQLELVVLALTSALLCGVAMAANHVMARKWVWSKLNTTALAAG
jgi:hypothetical protein